MGIRRFFSFLFFIMSFSCVYCQYKPYILKPYSTGSTVYETVKYRQNQANSYLEKATSYVEYADKAISEKNYSLASNYLETALEYIKKSGYQREMDSVIKKINETLDYCEYKKENPDDNPYYKSCIGYIDFNKIFAYGYGNEISFIAFQISFNNGCMMIKSDQINAFAELMKDIEISLEILSNKRIRNKELPRDFPQTLYLNYTNPRNSKYYELTPFEFNIIKYEGQFWVEIRGREMEFPYIYFRQDELDKLTRFRETISDAGLRFQQYTNEKVKDDDFFLNLIPK